ncbi:hypothetical protein ACQUMI_001871 [Enterococcus faecalis]|uniref:hypothetical protein n=1 Tax=Enterococcus faecalis TaxID=1351 RepID=UPI0019E04952|nr:hypothetical protein [Enterococcus faecalis]EGO5169118.1 hypothetical protein [Enterococcus faecalis]EGO9052173.1 hypothetical protein [Enterococcus faecalis]EGO9793938.1 hypothetical protein [Enterococcus faecalis]EIX2408202.1 hypothetical protein [Enterococcus faecalis]EJM6270720.1 hypothetical protein [Enterococcus faecalis]
MVLPLTKMWFVADYWGKSELSGTNIFAEYDILGKKVVWKKFSKQDMENQNHKVKKLLYFLPFTSLFIIVPFIVFLGNYTKKQVTPLDRLGSFGMFAPLLTGVLLFLILEYLMLYRRRYSEVIDAPAKYNQYTYFEELYERTVKNNDAVGKYKTPYLVSGLSILFLSVVVIPIMFWLYNMKGTFFEFFVKFIILSFLCSIVLSTIWNGIIKSVITKKIINKLTEELEI